jgi:prephenate dehydratase
MTSTAMPLSVAFQGEPGAYSEEAAILCCGRNSLLLPRRSFSDVVNAVLQGGATQGVLPLENSLIGEVAAANDAIAVDGVAVVKEITLPILHCLLGMPGATIESISQVLSHPAALAQCTAFFDAYTHIEPVEWYDTAGAAKHVANTKDTSMAAIASRRAAERYKLKIIAQDIQDRMDNRTRFVVIARS